MTEPILAIQEKVTVAFDKQAPEFDRLYGEDPIIQYKRKRVREQVEHWLDRRRQAYGGRWAPSSSILELNAGTGEDAVYFARLGHTVHATDISTGMLEMLIRKVRENQLDKTVSFERCSFTALDKLQQQGPYDMIFSNFAGLNCTSELKKVLASFSPLVKPGGFVTLVLLPRFCLWEFLLLFKGKFKTAFRRFAGRKGAPAKIGNEYFRCWYYNPSFVRRHLKKTFDTVALEGLCTVVPPSYIEGFAGKHPTLFNFLKKKEDRWKSRWPWRSVGDYYIITLQKKDPG